MNHVRGFSALIHTWLAIMVCTCTLLATEPYYFISLECNNFLTAFVNSETEITSAFGQLLDSPIRAIPRIPECVRTAVSD